MIRFAVDHPVATWMLFTAAIVTGIYAVPRLNIEAMPETDLPELSISTYWNGASPSAIQRSITLPIEEAAAGCHGVEDIDSRSRHSQSTVTVQYMRGTDMDFARLELSELLGAVRRNLPAALTPRCSVLLSQLRLQSPWVPRPRSSAIAPSIHRLCFAP